MTTETPRAKRAALFRLGTVLVAGLAVVGIAVTGHASLPENLQFVQAGHWVYNTSAQAAVHVDGATGQVDAQAAVPGAEAGSPVAQNGRSGYVVDRTRITEFSKSTLGVESSTAPPASEEPVVLEVAGGPYLVYRNAGQIARLGDPAATAPAGGPLSAPVTTSDGTVWVHRIDNGSICDLPRGALLLTCPAQLPQGHDAALSIVGDRPVVLDTTASVLRSVGANGLGDPADIGLSLPATVQVASDDVDGRLAVVDPDHGQLHLIDAAGLLQSSPVARPVSVPLRKGGQYAGPVATSHTVAVVDQARHEVRTYDSKGALKSTKAVPDGGGEARLSLGQDHRIYVDNHDGSHMVVVDGGSGVAADVDVSAKTQPKPTPPSQPEPPASSQSPAPPAPPGPPAQRGNPPPVAKPTPPGSPRNVRATPGTGSATVMWASAPGNGSRVVRYVVSWSGGSTTVDGSRSRVTVTGLTNGQSYTFTVAAENSAGRGSAASSRSIVPGGAAEAPKVTATVGSNGAVSVSWTTPDLHGADLVRYAVSASGQSDRSVSGTSTSFQGLSGTITFTVRAITSYGSGGQLTGSPGSARATLASGPPSVKITSVRSTNALIVTVEADPGGGAATCQASFMGVASPAKPCSGTTQLTISNVVWTGAVTIKATIRNSSGSGSDSWTGVPTTS
ncbi:fibronectin type III domain-containing protein [Amycolatopsis sp. GA6-003]|uniref:fibronectin type III domain-containing protein n=1 Tax=Amycolatopsis sp. GA6-003 TaxID=2652444 RepID=UPI0039175A49